MIELVEGDTGRVPYGTGTFGSRSMVIAGSAIVMAADKIIAKARRAAAHLLEAAESDIEHRIVDGRGEFRVAGTDRRLTWAEVARAVTYAHNLPPGMEPVLHENAFFDPVNLTWSNGAQACEVEIDPETGVTRLVAYVCVDDIGTVINPMVVEGQVHGAAAQGIGQAMFEGTHYDRVTGQLFTASFMDYVMPRADNTPGVRVGDRRDAAVHPQPARREGLRRVGHHRRAGGDHERHARCAPPARRRRDRHAVHARQGLEGHSRRAAFRVDTGPALLAGIDDSDHRPAAVRPLVHRIDRDEHRRIADRRRGDAAHRALRMPVVVHVRVVEHDLTPAAQEAAVIGFALQEAVHQPALQVLRPRARGQIEAGVADRVVDAVDVERVLHHRMADAIAPAGAGLVAEEHDLPGVELDARGAGGHRRVDVEVLADLPCLRHRDLAQGDARCPGAVVPFETPIESCTSQATVSPRSWRVADRVDRE